MLCECGCGQETTLVTKTNAKRGYVIGQHHRFCTGHNNCKGQSRSTKIQKVYEADPDTGCWNWLLFRTDKGYGRWLYKGKKGLAHRFFYIEHRGPLTEGMTLDHLCGNTSCVNPWHMEEVTFEENSKRKNGTGKCPSSNFIVISAMNCFKTFINSLRLRTA